MFFVLSILAMIVTIGHFIVSKQLKTEAFYPGFEVYGVDKGNLSLTSAKQKFMVDARRILFDGAAKAKGVFQVVSSNGPRLILPTRYAEEIKSHEHLSARKLIAGDLFSHLPGFEAAKALDHSDLIIDTIRKNLTHSPQFIVNAIFDEAYRGVQELYDVTTLNDGWHKFDPRTSVDLVARLSSRVFLGSARAKDPEWLKITTEYTIMLMTAVRAIRTWPAILRPIVHWLLPECQALRRISRAARRVIADELAQRRASPVGGSDELKESHLGQDSLSWMHSSPLSKGFNLADGQLFLSFAAIHTASDLLTKCLFNLCKFPKYQELLRIEAIDCLGKKGLTKAALFEMSLLDSFIKETQRLAPASWGMMNRVALQDVHLKDGTLIPQGAKLSVIPSQIFDGEIYRNPTDFDGHRFYNMRQDPKQANRFQLVSTSPHHAGFGYGQHACPGRFFASNELKIILANLLLTFEWRSEVPADVDTTIYSAAEVMPNPSMFVSFRKRSSGIDMSSMMEG